MTIIKTLTLDSSFEFVVDDNSSDVWKLRDGMTLAVELHQQYDNVIEFSIPELKVESYADLREGSSETLRLALERHLALEISEYALEEDEKLTPKALEHKQKILSMFERKDNCK